MPEDVEAVITELFARPAHEKPRARRRSARRLDGMDRLDLGVIAVDYGDEDHAFQITVERVPRHRWEPEQSLRIGHVDGVDVELVGVTVDNFVHVHLVAVRSDERDRLTRGYNEAMEWWAATPREARGELPEDPAGRLARITIRITDDLGTVYGLDGGGFGGTGTEWDARQSYRPRPPADAHELYLELAAPGMAAISLTVPLR